MLTSNKRDKKLDTGILKDFYFKAYFAKCAIGNRNPLRCFTKKGYRVKQILQILLM